MKHFPPLLALSQKFRLPLFLHSRTSEAHVDFVKVLKDAGWDSSWPGGVVHSFTGTIAEAKELVREPPEVKGVANQQVDMGLYIGINGCSLKTEENLEMVKTVPMHRILLETGKLAGVLQPCG
jgi:TatD DNase family protein